MALYKVSGAQLKAIFALGRKLGMDTEDLRGVAFRIGGVDSLRNLTGNQAGKMIEELKARTGERTQNGGGENRATAAQQRKLYVIVRELGWHDQPERLRGWLRRMCGVEDVRFLTPQQASRAIDGLKAMLEGGRAERKEAYEGEAQVGG